MPSRTSFSHIPLWHMALTFAVFQMLQARTSSRLCYKGYRYSDSGLFAEGETREMRCLQQSGALKTMKQPMAGRQFATS